MFVPEMNQNNVNKKWWWSTSVTKQ